jgi:hypothetical protein
LHGIDPREKLKIPKKKPFVMLLGAGADQTVITWDDTAAKTGTTFSSATVAVMSDAFIARGIAFEVCTYIKIKKSCYQSVSSLLFSEHYALQNLLQLMKGSVENRTGVPSNVPND